MYVESFKDKMRKARLDSGYTQAQIQDITGIKQSVISRIENGKLEPNIETLATLIDFYEVSADWILSTGKRK